MSRPRLMRVRNDGVITLFKEEERWRWHVSWANKRKQFESNAETDPFGRDGKHESRDGAYVAAKHFVNLYNATNGREFVSIARIREWGATA